MGTARGVYRLPTTGGVGLVAVDSKGRALTVVSLHPSVATPEEIDAKIQRLQEWLDAKDPPLRLVR